MSEAGHNCVGACEIDSYARLIYAKQFPGVRIWEDATKIDPKELPDFDVLTGGFPCQAFSIAGKRKGFDDTRGSMFFEIARIAKEKRPRYLLLENVKGLLNHDSGNTFRVIISTLDEMGYDAEWQVLNSKYFVPQNRERVFVVGHLRGERTRKIFPLGDCGKVSNGSQQKTSGGRPRIQSQHSCAVTATYWKGWSGDRQLIAEPEILAWSKSTRDWGVESRIKLGEANTLNTGEGCRNQSTANYVEKGMKIRRLTPLECERLQGFPDNWTEGISDTQRYKCCGNAVTVPVVKFVAENLS
jgi:DNA (cytosine-5)-methyltransferase 1